MSDDGKQRRDIIKYAGAATASIAVAGCLGGGGGDGDDGTTGGDDTTDGDTDDGPTETDTGGGGDTPEGGNVTITLGSTVTGIDPQDSAGRGDTNAALHMYEAPIFRGPDGSLGPALATEWERIEEGRDRLYIREGVQFHNGDTMTPEDVAYSVKRIMIDEVGPATTGAFMGDIVNAEVVDGENAVDIYSANLARADSDEDEGIGVNETPGPDERAFNYLVFDSCADGLAVMQKDWVQEREPSETQQDANGTGPYKLENFESGVDLEMSYFEDYWGGKDQPWETVTMQTATEGSTRVSQLLTGESDAVFRVPPQDVSRVNDSDNAEVVAGTTQRMIYITMRTDKEPWSSVKFRKALNYAVDQDAIIENVLDGFGQKYNQHALPWFDGYNEELPDIPHDPERAAELVEESGHAGADLNIIAIQGGYLKGVESTQAVANQIDQLPNVSCSAEPVEGAAYNVGDRDITTNNDMVLVGVGVIVPDCIRTFEFGLREGYGLWDKGTEFGIQEKYEEARQLRNKEDRIPLYKEINALVQEAWPFIYMNVMAAIFGVSSDIQWESRFDSRYVYAFEMYPQ
jgi:peptide/nickel transport system substrate-binding protein